MSCTGSSRMSVIYKNRTQRIVGRINAGYTLIELAIVLTVVGLLLAGAGTAYALYIKNKAITETATNTNLMIDAISNYFIQNGRYPCPARLDAKRTDADYGLPANLDANCADDTSIPVGTCSGGICIEESARTIDTWDILSCATEPGVCNFTGTRKVRYGLSNAAPPVTREGTFTSSVVCDHTVTPAFLPDPNVGSTKYCYTTSSSFTPRVRRGAVPFRLLNKQEPMAYDGYHNKIEYVVTENLTKVTTYNKNNGGISIVDTQPTPRSVIKDADSIHYIVVSHGEDGVGGYSNQGMQALPCTTGKDAQNCNTSLTNPKAIYATGQIADAIGADHFDDIVKYSSSVETPLWIVADTAGTDIKDAGLAPQIGIGSQSGYAASDPPSLDIVTNLRASARIYTPSVCKWGSTTNCFPPERVGGVDPEMDCKNPLKSNYDVTKPYMQGIFNGKAVCTNTSEVKCLIAGQVLKGITVTGNIICTAPPLSCPAQNVTVCNPNDDALIASSAGTVITTAVHGDSRQDTYTCSTSGAWSLTSSTGVCNCTAGTTTATPACTGYMNPPGSCWNGNVVVATTTTCGPFAQTSTTDTSACTCSGCTTTASNGCSAPLLIPTPSYAAGYTGSINYTNNWTCSSTTAGSFSGWTYASDNCVCNPSAPLTETNVSCTITGCDSSGAAVLNGQQPCSAGFAGSGKYVNRYKNYNCPGAYYDTAWTNTANTCACTAVVRGQQIGCPTGYSGIINQSSTFDCATNAWGPWTNNLTGTPPSTCTPIQWKPQGSISGSGTSAIGFEAFSGCSPVNSTASCWTPSGTGNPYNYYAVCKCQ